MGIQKKIISMSWDEETFVLANRITEMLAPFVESRSHLCRIVFQMFHKIISTQGTLQVLTNHLQVLNRINSSHQLELDFSNRKEKGAGSHPAEREPLRLRVVSENAARAKPPRESSSFDLRRAAHGGNYQ